MLFSWVSNIHIMPCVEIFSVELTKDISFTYEIQISSKILYKKF